MAADSTHYPMTPQEAEEVRQRLRAALLAEREEQGLTDKKLTLRLKQGLNAHSIRAQISKKTGNWSYSKQLIDNTTRLKALDMALTVYDLYPAQRRELSGPGGGNIPIQASPDELAFAKHFAIEQAKIEKAKSQKKVKRKKNGSGRTTNA